MFCFQSRRIQDAVIQQSVCLLIRLSPLFAYSLMVVYLSIDTCKWYIYYISYTFLYNVVRWLSEGITQSRRMPSIMLHLSERLPQETWLGQCQIESAQPNSFCNLVVARITGRQTTCRTFARPFGNKMALWQQSPLAYSLGICLVGKSRVDSIWDMSDTCNVNSDLMIPYSKCSMSHFCFLKLLYVARLWRLPVYLGYITPRVNWGLFVRSYNAAFVYTKNWRTMKYIFCLKGIPVE